MPTELRNQIDAVYPAPLAPLPWEGPEVKVWLPILLWILLMMLCVLTALPDEGAVKIIVRNGSGLASLNPR